ncbi:hypothetical protein KJ359_009632 [Pestalotiopsis sp. 9143b]|nr:hypothetical protein KJ359_009632 [Pestalotiopsis sp. 9143b]
MFPFPSKLTWTQNWTLWLRNQLIQRGIRSSATPVSRLFDAVPVPRRILFLGLDAAGKSHLLRKHFSQDGGRDVLEHMFIICFHVEEVRCGNVAFCAYDTCCSRPGGVRKLERRMLAEADAVVWVVDSNDIDRPYEGREEFNMLLNHESEGLGGEKPVLLLFNKSDLPNAMGMAHVDQQFGSALEKLNSYAVKSSVVTGEGLLDGFKWLSERLQGKPIEEINEKAPASTSISRVTEKS